MRRLIYMTDERLDRLDRFVLDRLEHCGVARFWCDRRLSMLFPELDRHSLGMLLAYYMSERLPAGLVVEDKVGCGGRKHYTVYRGGKC